MIRLALVAPPWKRMASPYPPLGLAYLAGSAEMAGAQTKIFDFSLYPQASLPNAVGEVARFSPGLVGITTWTHTYDQAIALSRALREQTDAILVLGGPHATVFPEQTLTDSGADFVVVGEGEETLRELLLVLAGEQELERVPGLCYLRNGKPVRTRPRALSDSLDTMPAPARHQLSLAEYSLQTHDGQPMTTVLTSRGCPHGCAYCFKGVFGAKYRQRSAAHVIAELKGLIQEHQITNFYFVDDLFTHDRDRLEALCGLIEAERLEICWQCLARVDRLQAQHYRLMARAGCTTVHFGIESGCQRLLDAIGKRITLKQIRQAVRWARRAGLRTKGYFMTGLPGETRDEVQATIDFACRLRLDEAMFSVTTPFPGTKLWRKAIEAMPALEEGHSFSKAFYFLGDSTEVRPFFNLSEMTDAELGQMTKLANDAFWKKCTRRREFVERFGLVLGTVLWRLSTWQSLKAISPVRALGHRVSTALAKPRASHAA